MFVPSALEGILEPTLTGLGFELVDAQVSNRGRFVRIFVDKPGGVTVDDCAAVSRHLSHLFEALGRKVSRLLRVRYGPVELPRDLRPGQCLELDEKSVAEIVKAAKSG